MKWYLLVWLRWYQRQVWLDVSYGLSLLTGLPDSRQQVQLLHVEYVDTPSCRLCGEAESFEVLAGGSMWWWNTRPGIAVASTACWHCLDGVHWDGELPGRSGGYCPEASAIHVACMNCLQLVAMPQEEVEVEWMAEVVLLHLQTTFGLWGVRDGDQRMLIGRDAEA